MEKSYNETGLSCIMVITWWTKTTSCTLYTVTSPQGRYGNDIHSYYRHRGTACLSLWKCATGKYAEQAKHTSHYCYQEYNLSLYCGSLLPMCCYPYLVLYMDICSPFEEDLSCLCVSILSCKYQSRGSILTILEGGGERCDGEKTVQDVIFLRN